MQTELAYSRNRFRPVFGTHTASLLPVATAPVSVQDHDVTPPVNYCLPAWPGPLVAIFDKAFTADACRAWTNFQGVWDQVVSRAPDKIGLVLARRWVIERSFGRLQPLGWSAAQPGGQVRCLRRTARFRPWPLRRSGTAHSPPDPRCRIVSPLKYALTGYLTRRVMMVLVSQLRRLSKFCALAFGSLLLGNCTPGMADVNVPKSPTPPGTERSMPNPKLHITATGDPDVVYRWSLQRCSKLTIPDAPARAFRDANGNVRLLAASSENWSMVGRDLNSVRPDCGPLFLGSQSADPADFDDLPWIEATYTLDGKHVTALISNEWNAFRHPSTALARESGCTDPHQQSCYFYSITQAFSADNGLHFRYLDRRIAAALPEPFHREHTAQGSHGFATVSNILRYAGMFYAFVGSRGGGVQPSGNCLIRTSDISDPTSWRAWDGTDFTVQFVDPYRDHPKRPQQHVCQTIAVPGNGSEEVRSISWHPASRNFIAVMRGRLIPFGGHDPVPGFFFATSQDLVHWSRAELIMPIATQQECRPWDVYPSILDPVSPDRNFETITDNPYLYFTRFNVDQNHCRGTMDRDLLRVHLAITHVPSR